MRKEVKQVFEKNEKFMTLSNQNKNLILKDFQIGISLSCFEHWMEDIVSDEEDISEEDSLKIEIEQAKRYLQKIFTKNEIGAK